MAIALEVRGLWKCYAAGVRGCSARIWVLRGLSLTVASGERVGVIGARAAGKTTLIECLRGLRRPDAGVIEVPGGGRLDVALVDDGEPLPHVDSTVSRTAIVAARHVSQVVGIVDRCLLLRDGKLLPFQPPTRARRVAEGRIQDC